MLKLKNVAMHSEGDDIRIAADEATAVTEAIAPGRMLKLYGIGARNESCRKDMKVRAPTFAARCAKSDLPRDFGCCSECRE